METRNSTAPALEIIDEETERLLDTMLSAKRNVLGEDVEISKTELEIARQMSRLSGIEMVEAYENWRSGLEEATGFRERLKELTKERDELKVEANTDKLTGTKNRRFFEGYLGIKIAEINSAREAKEHRRKGEEDLGFCLIMLDIDNFKTVNDQRGHDGGDEVLRGIAQTAMKTLRKNDVVCRWGGDEFIVLIEAGREDGIRIARELQEQIAKEVSRKELGDAVGTVSVGVSSYRPTDTQKTMEILLKEADAAAYHSKENGRNQVTAYEMQIIDSEETEKMPRHNDQTFNEIGAILEDEN